jgi:SAM-dependent methyltransferase
MPASCCSDQTRGTNNFFSKNAETYLRRFRKKGLRKEQRSLAEGISSVGLADRTVLEIGCGVGGLHLTLLQRGARSAVGVDISEGMIFRARALSAELGFGARTEYLLGDIVAAHADAPPCDIVVLDKVVCCYEDLDSLLDISLTKTGRVYALSFPRPHRVNRWGVAAITLIGRIFRWSFVPQWHDWDRMLGRIRAGGFAERYAGQSLFWSVRVFERA